MLQSPEGESRRHGEGEWTGRASTHHPLHTHARMHARTHARTHTHTHTHTHSTEIIQWLTLTEFGMDSRPPVQSLLKGLNFLCLLRYTWGGKGQLDTMTEDHNRRKIANSAVRASFSAEQWTASCGCEHLLTCLIILSNSPLISLTTLWGGRKRTQGSWRPQLNPSCHSKLSLRRTKTLTCSDNGLERMYFRRKKYTDTQTNTKTENHIMLERREPG